MSAQNLTSSPRPRNGWDRGPAPACAEAIRLRRSEQEEVVVRALGLLRAARPRNLRALGRQYTSLRALFDTFAAIGGEIDRLTLD